MSWHHFALYSPIESEVSSRDRCRMFQNKRENNEMKRYKIKYLSRLSQPTPQVRKCETHKMYKIIKSSFQASLWLAHSSTSNKHSTASTWEHAEMFLWPFLPDSHALLRSISEILKLN